MIQTIAELIGPALMAVGVGGVLGAATIALIYDRRLRLAAAKGRVRDDAAALVTRNASQELKYEKARSQILKLSLGDAEREVARAQAGENEAQSALADASKEAGRGAPSTDLCERLDDARNGLRDLVDKMLNIDCILCPSYPCLSASCPDGGRA